MSLKPLLLDLEEQMADANGYGLYPDLHRCPYLMRRYPHNPQSHWQNHCGTSVCGNLHKPIPKKGKDGFEIKMNVQNFAPNEITVKVVENNVVIEAKHDERSDDHGSVFRHFIRKYIVPSDCDMEKVISTLSSDGIVSVKSPLKCTKDDPSIERVIEIQSTGPANLSKTKRNEEDSDGWETNQPKPEKS